MACTDIHTTPTKLIKALLNPNISIRLNGIKKSGGGGGGMPTPRIVYDSTTINNTASLAIEEKIWTIIIVMLMGKLLRLVVEAKIIEGQYVSKDCI